MQLFYDPDLKTGPHALRPAEAQHAARVLRKRVGDVLDLVDGKGGWFRGTITDIDKRSCYLDVTALRREDNRAAQRLTLLVAPTKNIDRFEWILEKATELGIDVVQPVLCDHSERKKIRTDRLDRIVESAMKQSLRAWLPELRDLRSFSEAISALPTDSERHLAYLGAEGSPLLHRAVTPGRDSVVAIGPEGGFSPGEAALARSHDFGYVSLGPHRLRTETAAIAAVHTLNQINW